MPVFSVHALQTELEFHCKQCSPLPPLPRGK